MSKLLKLCVHVLALLTSSLAWSQQASLDVGTASGTAGSVVSVPVDLATDQAIAAMQLDLTFPSTVVTPTAAVLGGSASNHVLASAVVGSVYRVVIYSTTNAPLTSGRLTNVTFTISGAATPQTVPIGIQGVVLSSASAVGIATTGLDAGSITVSPAGSPALTLTHTQNSGPASVTAAGQVLGYLVVVTNTGTLNQNGVVVTGTRPVGGAAVLAGPVESQTPNGILEVGETWSYTSSYTVTQADVDAGAPLVSSAQVVTAQVPGPTTGVVTTQIVQSPALTITKSQISGPNPVTASGQVLGYRIVISNTGNVSQSTINTTDTLPSGLPAVLPAPTQSISVNSILEVGETWTYSTDYTVSPADFSLGLPLVNTARVTTTQVAGPSQATAVTPMSTPFVFANGFENPPASLKLTPARGDVVVKLVIDASVGSGPLVVGIADDRRPVFRVDVRRETSELWIRGSILTDDGEQLSSWARVDAESPLLLNFWVEKPPGAHNGGLRIWAEGREVANVVGMGRDDALVTELQFPDQRNQLPYALSRQLHSVEILEDLP